jgi:hypothetical protein
MPPRKPVKKPAPRKPAKSTALVPMKRPDPQRVAEAVERLQESDWFNTTFPDFMDRYYANGQWWFPAGSVPGFGGTANKLHGFDAYVFRTEQELRLQRDHARMLVAREPIAQAILRHMRSFVVNKGWSYTVSPKLEAQEQVKPEDVTKINGLLKEWMKRRRWNLRERELFDCYFTDGEFLLHLPVYKGELEDRRLEPEHITNPNGGNQTNGWYLGVQCELDDPETVKAYNWRLPPLMAEKELKAKDIVHGKANVTRNVTRGISYFFAMLDDVDGAGKLMDNIRTGAQARAEIAFWYEHKNGTADAITTFADSLKDYSRTHPTTGKTDRIKTNVKGRTPNFSDVTQIKTVPTGDVESNVAALQAQFRVICNALGMPEFMSGDASNANYASTQMAGSPFVRAVEGIQEELRPHFEAVMQRVLEQEVAKGNLSPSLLAQLEVMAEPPSPVMEDELQKAQCQQIYVEMGAKSVPGVIQELGGDVEKTQQENDEWLEANQERLAMENGTGGGEEDVDPDAELDSLESSLSEE